MKYTNIILVSLIAALFTGAAIAYTSVPTITDGIGFQYEDITIGNDKIKIGNTNITKDATIVIAAINSMHTKGADFVCDGVDDQVEINKAIDSASVGGKVQLMEGAFKITAPIKMNRSVWLAGSHVSGAGGVGTMIILQPNSNCDIIRVDGDGTHLFFPHISDMFLDGDRINQTCGNGIHYIADLSDTIVQNVFIEQCKENGICEDAGWYMRYNNVWSEYNGEAGWKVLDSWIDNCVSSENYGHGILVHNAAAVHVVNTRIKRNDYHGIMISGWTPRECVINSNSIVDNSNEGAGIYDGIHIEGGHETYFRGISIVGNVIGIEDGNAQRSAIRLEDGNGIIITGNTLYAETVNPTLINNASGTENVVRNNVGFITENSGTDTLVSGAVGKTVTHGLDVTPVAGDIMVTAMESLGSASFFWINGYTSTTFNITVNANPGQDVDFAWKAIVL